MDQQHWQDRLSTLAQEHRVVGASLALRLGDTVVTASTGILNLRTGYPVTPETVFLVGSITKVWTATLVLQLVDEGLVELDAPVITYLPAFRVADPEVSRTVTVRQLLCHTSGIDGDFFPDFGRGDDALPRFVEAMADLKQIHPQGAIMSYTNSGFVLLGHLVATMRGTTWEKALRDHLFTPLGLTRAGALPEEALLHGATTGHLLTEDGVIVTPVWAISRCCGPSGAIHCTPSDLLVFAQLHLSGGLGLDGARLLSEASVQAMQATQVMVKSGVAGAAQGLGWELDDWGGQRVFGHSGQTTGHLAFLDVLPESGLVFALTTNGGHNPSQLYEDLVTEVARDLVGVIKAPALAPPAVPLQVDAARFVGTWACEGFQAVIAENDGRLQMSVSVSDQLADLMVPAMLLDLHGYADDVLLGRMDGIDEWFPSVFFEIDADRYFHGAGRAFKRQDG